MTKRHKRSASQVMVLGICLLGSLAISTEADTPLAVTKPVPNWKTPKAFKTMAAHPRLFISQAQIDRMGKGRGEEYTDTYKQIEDTAETGIRDAEKPFKVNRNYNYRGFMIQGRLTSLAIQWHRTKDRKYLDAAIKNMAGMQEWVNPNGSITLQEGQYMSGLAVGYDLLKNDMTPEERLKIVNMVRKYFIHPFLRNTATGKNMLEHGERGIWWQRRLSNWNPVCAAGAGMLALTMYEDLEEAQTVIDRVTDSFAPIIREFEECEGGWIEGLGYWNWTVHYLSLYYMSYERATGQEHTDFRSEGFKKTMTYGLYFVPHDEACGFGDNQHGGIGSSTFAAAEHLKYNDVLNDLQTYRKRSEAMKTKKKELRAEAKPKLEKKEEKKDDKKEEPKDVNINYGPPQHLLICPDPLKDSPVIPTEKAKVKYFPKQGWGMVADVWPSPNFYASVRGGVCAGDHTHADLLSWNAVIGIEKMIHNIYESGYYRTAFQSRSSDIYERNQTSKNTLFINGVSAYTRVYTKAVERFGGPATAQVKTLQLPTGAALRLDASTAFWYGAGRQRPTFAGRLFTTIDDKALLVLDRVVPRSAGPVEARAFTKKKATFGKTDVLLEGDFETARMTFAADQPMVLRRAVALSTEGKGTPPTMMRWQTEGSVSALSMATVLTRGKEPVEVTVKTEEGIITVTIKTATWEKIVKVTDLLETY